MLSWFGKLFGTEKSLEKTIQTVSNGIDKLIYTDEEKADNAAKERSEARQMVVHWMQATQGQNLARRLIAFLFTTSWVMCFICSTMMKVISAWVSDPAPFIQSAKYLDEGLQQVSPAVMLILAFYFAAPHMGDIAKVALQKFGNNKKT